MSGNPDARNRSDHCDTSSYRGSEKKGMSGRIMRKVITGAFDLSASSFPCFIYHSQFIYELNLYMN